MTDTTRNNTKEKEAARRRFANAILAHAFIRQSPSRVWYASTIHDDAEWRVRNELVKARRHWVNTWRASAAKARAFERATLAHFNNAGEAA